MFSYYITGHNSNVTTLHQSVSSSLSHPSLQPIRSTEAGVHFYPSLFLPSSTPDKVMSIKMTSASIKISNEQVQTRPYTYIFSGIDTTSLYTYKHTLPGPASHSPAHPTTSPLPFTVSHHIVVRPSLGPPDVPFSSRPPPLPLTLVLLLQCAHYPLRTHSHSLIIHSLGHAHKIFWQRYVSRVYGIAIIFGLEEKVHGAGEGRQTMN